MSHTKTQFFSSSMTVSYKQPLADSPIIIFEDMQFELSSFPKSENWFHVEAYNYFETAED